MLLMKVDIFLLLFACGCVCASGEGGGGKGGYGSREIPYVFFSSLLFLFRLARERTRIFGCRFCPPEQ